MNRQRIVCTGCLFLAATLACCATTAQAVEHFAEDFASGTLPAQLGLTDKYVSPGQTEVNPGGDLVDLSGGNVTYYPGQWNRQYVQTADTDYSNVDFVYEGTVTTSGLSDWSIAFFGMGACDTDPRNSGEPLSTPRLDANLWNSADLFRIRDNTLFGGVGQVPLADATHRVRMTWDAATQQAEFAIDLDYGGGPMVPDHVFWQDGSDNGLNKTNSRLYFGGGNGLVFDDVSVTYAPPRTIGTTNLALGKPVLYTSSEYQVAAGMDFVGSHVTDGRNVGGLEQSQQDYWIAEDQANTAYFVLDLEEEVNIAQITLFNTHNWDYHDRGTREFEIYASNTVQSDGMDLVGGVSILSGELGNTVDGIPGQVFNGTNGLSGGTYRYLKFVALSPYGTYNCPGLNEIQVFGPSDPIFSYQWDGPNGTDWSAANWSDPGDNPVGDTPGTTISAFVKSNTVNVSADEQARRLVVSDSGGVNITGGSSLTVAYDTDFALGTTLSMGADSKLVAAGGNIPAIAPAGNVTIGVPSGTLTAAGYNDSLPASMPRTFIKQGDGTLSLSNDNGADVVAPQTTFKIEGGTLSSIGADPLGGATSIELAGGTLKLSDATFGLAAHFSFDNDLNPGYDDTDNGHDGTLTNGAVYDVGGKLNGAVKFDGLDDFITAPINVSETNYAVSLWFKADADDVSLFSVTNGDPEPTGWDRCIFVADGGLGSRVHSDELIRTTDMDLDDGHWHHLVHTFGGEVGGQKLYVDGVLASSGSKDYSDFNWDDRILIGYTRDATGGYFPGSDYFQGLIDEVRIFDSALDSAKVAALYQSGQTGVYGGQMNLSAKNVTVTGPSTLDLSSNPVVTLNDLVMKDGGSLTTTGAVPGISFNSTTIHAEAQWVGFDPQVPTSYDGVSFDADGIDANNVDVTIAKSGSGTWTVSLPPSNLHADADFEVAGGTLRLRGTDTLGGRDMKVTEGTLDLAGGTALGTSPVEMAGGRLLVVAPAPIAPPGNNLLLHLDASAITANDGDPVATWSDLAAAGGADDATQVDPNAQPTYQSNALGGQPAVRFDGNDFLGTTTSFDNYTIFAVGQLDGTQNARLISSASNNWLLGFWGGQMDVMHANGAWVAYPGPTADTAPHIYEGSGVGGLNSFYSNGSQLASNVPATTTLGQLGLGGTGYSGAITEYSRGDVAEILIYNGTLSDADRNLAGVYLGAKYGLTTAYLGDVPLDMTATELAVTADSTIEAYGSPTNFGNLTMVGGTLSTTGAPAGSTYASTTVHADAEWVGFDPRVPTSYNGGVSYDADGIDANNVANVTIAKAGPSAWTVSLPPTNLHATVDFEVAGGVLRLRGTDTLGGRDMKISDGTLDLVDQTAIGAAPVELAGGILRVGNLTPPSTDLQLHLDARKASPDGEGRVGVWHDQSGNGHDAFQGSLASQPTYVDSGLNGLPALRFDGANDSMVLGDLSNSFPSEATMFIVTTLNGDAAYNLFVTMGNDGWWRYDGNGFCYPGMFRSTRVEAYTAMPTDGSYIYAVESSATNWEMFSNGASLGAAPADYYAGNDYRIGAPDTLNNFATQYLAGDIAEVLIYDSALSATEHDAVGSYLAQKYGLGATYTGSSLAPTSMTGTAITVTADSAINAFGAPTSFGTLTMGEGVLTTSGAGAISFPSTAVDSEATEVGFNTNVPTTLGPINGGGAPVTISTNGRAPLVLSEATTGLDHADAGWDVRGGVTRSVGMAPLGSAAVKVSGGALEMLDAASLGAAEINLAGGTFCVTTAQPVAYYSFDNSGAPGTDDSGLGHDGTLLGGAAWNASGKIGGAVEFDGVDGFISAMIDLADTSYAVSLWFKADADGGGLFDVIGEEDLGAYNDRNLRLNDDGNVAGRVYTEETILTSGLSVADGGWHHVVHTYGGLEGGEKLYVDGVLEASGSKAFSDFDWQDRIHIGWAHFAPTGYFDGLIDEVYVYDRALTAAEAGDLFSGISVPGGPNPTTDAIDFTVTANSKIHVSSTSGSSLGHLVMKNGVLTTGGSGGITFDETVIDVDAVAVGFDTVTGTDLGVITVDAAQPVTVSKSGPADLVLTKASVGLPGFSMVTFDVREGRLVGLDADNPFDEADLLLSGGELVLAAETVSPPAAVFDNPVTITADSTITAGTGDVGVSGVHAVLGSSGNGLTLESGTVDLRSLDNCTLEVAGQLSGDGGVAVTDGQVILSGGGSMGLLNAVGGSLDTAGNDFSTNVMSVAGDAQVSTGSANHVTVNDRLTLGEITFNSDAGHPLEVGGLDLLDSANVKLTGGTLDVLGPGGLPVDPQAYYSFDDEANPGADGGGSGYDGTLLGGPVWDEDGRSGGALNFDGVDDTVSALVNVSETSYAVSMWFKAGSDDCGLFSVTDGDPPEPTGWDRTVYVTGGTVGARVWTDETIRSPVLNAANGDWHHVVHTFGGTEGGQKLYVDGLLQQTGVKDFSDWTGQDRILIGFCRDGTGGFYPGVDFFVGGIDEVYVYDRALTADEVTGLYGLGMDVVMAPNVNLLVDESTTVGMSTLSDAVFGDVTIEPGVTLTFTGAPAVNISNLNGGDLSTLVTGQGVSGFFIRGNISPGTSSGKATGSGTMTISGFVEMAEEDAGYAADFEGTDNDLVVVQNGDIELAGELSVQSAGKLDTIGDQVLTIMQVSGEDGIYGEFALVPKVGDFSLPSGDPDRFGTYLGNGAWFGNDKTGEGVTYVGRTYDPPEEYDPDDQATAMTISVFQAKAGDCNGDRSISFADFNDLANNYTGALAPGVGGKEWRQGDFNSDADVDFGDFNDLANNYTGAGVEYGPGGPAGGAKAAPGEASLIVYLADVTGADGQVHAAGDVVLSVEVGEDASSTRINGYEVYSAGGLLVPDEGGAPYPLIGGAYMEDSAAAIVAFGGLTSPLVASGDQDWTLGWKYDVQAEAAGDLEFSYGTAAGVISGNVLYVVPEPGTLLLLACGALGLLLTVIRRKPTP